MECLQLGEGEDAKLYDKEELQMTSYCNVNIFLFLTKNPS